MSTHEQGWAGPRPDPPEPITVPTRDVDITEYFEPQDSIPVWVRMTFADGSVEHMKGFAHGWTRKHVKVQVSLPKGYYRGATDVWVTADQVRRRALQEGGRRGYDR